MYNILFGRRKKFQLNKAETTYKVHYLGNVMTSLIKGGYHHGQEETRNNKYNQSNCADSSSIIQQKLTQNSDDDDDDEDDTDVSLIAQQVTSNLSKKFNNIICNVDKPVKILWDNHLKHNGHAGLKMKLTLTQGGLRVDTKDHGLTEYYGHRIHFIQAHPLHPKLFVWVYQHVGKNLKTEIRCHAAMCQSAREARSIEHLLNDRLQRTFLEYKREKRRQQNSRLCNSKNGGILLNQFGTRKRSFRSTKNYKPPVQHGMSSAPKLDDVIEEEEEPVEEREITDHNLKNESITHSNESENEDTFIENDITETGAEDEFEEEEEEEEHEICNTEEDEDHVFNETIDKQPIREQLILSSSSSSASSSSTSSPLHSNLSSPSFNKPAQQQFQPQESTDLAIGSSIASSSSSSNSSDLNNCSFDLDTNSNEEHLDLKLVDCKLNANKKNFETIDNNNHNDYTEVSYDFLADLSKLHLAHSKSFTNRNYQLASLIENPPPLIEAKTFYNPFRRTNISKSFSTFTTRLKSQQQQQQKKLTTDLVQRKSKELEFSDPKHQSASKQNKSQSRCSTGKTYSDTTESPISSPDLSTSSSSSFNSNSNKTNNHLIQSLND